MSVIRRAVLDEGIEVVHARRPNGDHVLLTIFSVPIDGTPMELNLPAVREFATEAEAADVFDRLLRRRDELGKGVA